MKPFHYCSDTHLRNRAGDEQFAFTQIVDEAVRLKPPALVAAGDLFDKQSNRAASVAFAYRQIDRLEEAGVRFLFLAGQHDQDEPQWFSGHRWAECLHKQTVEIGELVLYGLHWQPAGKLQDELSEVPDSVNVLVCHQVWDEWMGTIACPQGSFANVPAHVKMLLTGDLHQKRFERRRNAGGEKMLVVSTGATTRQKIDEPNEHFWATVAQDYSVVFKALKGREYLDWGAVNRAEDVDRLVAAAEAELAVAAQRATASDLPAELCKPVLRVTYPSTVPETVRRIEKAVAGRATVLFKEVPPEAKQEAYKAAQAGDGGAAVTPLSVLADEVDLEAEPDTYGLVERLLVAAAGGDQEAEFARWRAEYLGESG